MLIFSFPQFHPIRGHYSHSENKNILSISPASLFPNPLWIIHFTTPSVTWEFTKQIKILVTYLLFPLFRREIQNFDQSFVSHTHHRTGPESLSWSSFDVELISSINNRFDTIWDVDKDNNMDGFNAFGLDFLTFKLTGIFIGWITVLEGKSAGVVCWHQLLAIISTLKIYYCGYPYCWNFRTVYPLQARPQKGNEGGG